MSVPDGPYASVRGGRLERRWWFVRGWPDIGLLTRSQANGGDREMRFSESTQRCREAGRASPLALGFCARSLTRVCRACFCVCEEPHEQEPGLSLSKRCFACKPSHPAELHARHNSLWDGDVQPPLSRPPPTASIRERLCRLVPIAAASGRACRNGGNGEEGE